MPNNFYNLDATELPDESAFQNLVSNFQYRRIETHELPEPLRNNGLIKKCNSFILAASGSTDGMLYSAIGIRPDKGDIDEHPFVLYYNYNDSSKNFGGIIHHGNWVGRTTPMEPWQIDAIRNSGLTASFTYKEIPPNASGSLSDLNEKGMLDGLSDQFEILMKNQPK